jgi:acyl-CoA thioesterase
MFALATGSIDASWFQGRGAFGGLLAGLLLSSMEEEVADAARAPRSLTVHFAGPAAEGPYTIATEIVRKGSRVTAATARLSSRGVVSTFGSASFCADRPADTHYGTATMPEVDPPESLRPFPRDFTPGGLPVFLQHLDVRFCGGQMPFSSAAKPGIAAWVKLTRALPVDAAVASLLIDALPPAICAMFDVRRAVASVDFRIDFFERLPRSRPEDFHLVSIASRWAGSGYTEELRELWTRDGVLLAQCRQLVALLA